MQAKTQAQTFSCESGPRSISYFFSFRIDEHGDGWTPLHEACAYNKDEIALFLISEEKKRVSAEGDQQQHQTPSYNMQDWEGVTPVFLTRSEKIVEEMVKLHDLELTAGDGTQLLEKGEDGFCWWGLGAITGGDILHD